MRYRFLRFPQGKTKAVTLSYDDACCSDIQLSEIITSYGIKGTFNINSTWLAKDDRHLTPEDVVEHILDKGHEVALHGAKHIALGNVRALEGIREVLDCRIELEKTFGRIIRGMAYADCGIIHMNNGASYENIRQYLKDLDIAYARALGKENNTFMLPTDWYTWMPTVHNTNPQVLEYADKFVAIDVNGDYPATRMPRLFYLWGHSYEFEREDGWKLLDSLCQKLAHNADTWYATNIEIYDYVNAYQSLVFSADNSIVYNPSLFKVWFDIDGEMFCVSPGETLTLGR